MDKYMRIYPLRGVYIYIHTKVWCVCVIYQPKSPKGINVEI